MSMVEQSPRTPQFEQRRRRSVHCLRSSPSADFGLDAPCVKTSSSAIGLGGSGSGAGGKTAEEWAEPRLKELASIQSALRTGSMHVPPRRMLHEDSASSLPGSARGGSMQLPSRSGLEDHIGGLAQNCTGAPPPPTEIAEFAASLSMSYAGMSATSGAVGSR